MFFVDCLLQVLAFRLACKVLSNGHVTVNLIYYIPQILLFRFGLQLLYPFIFTLTSTGITFALDELNTVYFCVWFWYFASLRLKFRYESPNEATAEPNALPPAEATPHSANEVPNISQQAEKEENESRNADKKRLEELRTELKKIPVSKVKQWHSEGKLTDEQYRTVAKKYNSMKKEFFEIQARLAQSEDET